jgi:hypothetical protein
MKTINILFFLFLFLPLSFLFSQTLVHESVSKPHYKIYTSDPSITSLTKYVEAADNFILIDEFRFDLHRRILKFQHEEVFIELYSAQELLSLYGKIPAESTIRKGSSFYEIEVYITDDLLPTLSVLQLKVPILIY